MTTTDLIKILKDTEYGAISHKPRNISLTINGKYMPDPRITLSSTGDGIAGPEIDLDIDGEFFEEQQPCEEAVSRQAVLEYIEGSEAELGHSSENELVCQYIKELPPVTPQQKTGHWIDDKCSECGMGIEDLIDSSEWYRNENPKYCPFCGIKIQPYKDRK